MKKDFCKIIFVVDRSGSMHTIAADMIGGFNQFIKTQKENKIGECCVSFVQFDDIYEEVYKNIDIDKVEELTDKTYQPRNMTALLDAVGKTINNVGAELTALTEEEKPDKVLMVILTDGEENASKEFTADKVKEMIKLQTETYNWQFLFIGANVDSWRIGQSLGIDGNKTMNYVSTGINKTLSTQTLWSKLSDKVVGYRASTYGTSIDFTDAERKEQEDLIKNNKAV